MSTNVTIKERYLHIILILIIIIGLGARFYGLDTQPFNIDEEFYIIGVEKFYVGSEYDVRLWNYHAPPVSKYLMSLMLVFAGSVNYDVAYSLPPNLFVYNYIAYESIAQIFALVRLLPAIFGVLFVVFIYLLAKELYGKTAGLWAAASSAIAIDFILFSRVIQTDIFLFTFFASTLYCYVKYRKTEKYRFHYLIAFFVSLVLLFGTKNLQSWIILPPLLYVEIIGNKKDITKTINFLIVVGIAWFLHSTFIYPPEIAQQAYDYFTGGQASQLIYTDTSLFLKSLFTINSYFYVIGFFLTLLYYLKRAGKQKIKRHFTHPTVYSLFFFLALFFIPIFSLSTLNQDIGYTAQFTIPFFVLSSFVITVIWKKYPIAKPVLLILLIISTISVVAHFPSYDSYPGKVALSYTSPESRYNALRSEITALGNPRVITNNMNLLLFYENAVPVPPRNSPSCTQEFLAQLQNQQFVGVLKNIGQAERGFLCDVVFSYREEIPIDNPKKLAGETILVRY